MTRPILVTGATGTVGQHVVRELAERTSNIRVGLRDPEAAPSTLPATADVVAFNFEKPETWGESLKDIDRLFLLLPPGIDVSTIQEFADAADRVGVDHVVYLSILGAEKLPILPHRRIEKHLAQTGMAYTFLRASWFMQNLSEIHRPEIVDRDEIFVAAGDVVLSLIDARDVAAVAETVLIEPGHRNRAYDLTGPAALDFHEVADVLSEVLDRPISYADPSRLAFGWHMYQRGFSPGFVAFMIVEYSVVRLGRSGRTTGDVETLLGREPRTVREFAEDYADIFRPERTSPDSHAEPQP